MLNQSIRVRFAPSPTGGLHIGGVRTALYNYLFAQANGGDMILRIEDTDSQRFVEGAEEYIIESLKWLGINYNEGVGSQGEYGPYRQSERKDIYKKQVKQLLDNGKAYYAFDSAEELEQKRQEIKNFQYDAQTRMSMRNSLTMSEEDVKQLIAQGEKYVVRFKIEANEEVIVHDLIRGEVSFNSSILDDKVIYKSADELPTYHLANIVDDHLMKISHVIRGEEWLPSAPLHVLLYRAFNWEEEMPQFAHLPLLLKPDGNGKLSKRDGDRLGFPVFPLEWKDPKTGETASGYRENGFLPEALINFVALLGWNPGGDESEILSMEELIQSFKLEKCSKAGAKFDYKKGNWFNQQYIQKASIESLLPLVKDQLIKENLTPNDDKVLAEIIGLVRERCQLLGDFYEQVNYFFKAPEEYDEKTVRKRWKEQSSNQMQELIEILKPLPQDLPSEETEEKVKAWISEKEYGMGAVMNCFRLALVGAAKGPHLFDITAILKKEETIKRLEQAIRTLG